MGPGSVGGEQVGEDQVNGDIDQSVGKRYAEQGSKTLGKNTEGYGDGEDKDQIKDRAVSKMEHTEY